MNKEHKTLQEIKDLLDNGKIVFVTATLSGGTIKTPYIESRYLFELRDLVHWVQMFNPTDITFTFE